MLKCGVPNTITFFAIVTNGIIGLEVKMQVEEIHKTNHSSIAIA